MNEALSWINRARGGRAAVEVEAGVASIETGCAFRSTEASSEALAENPINSVGHRSSARHARA